MHPIDIACIAAYLLFIVLLGAYYSREQKTTQNYFLAGKSMSWLPLAISMYATLFSSISYVMAPAEAFRHDLQYLMALVMFPFASVAAIVLFIDFYVRLRITTVYEYVEIRFNRTLSWTLMTVFMLFRCLYASIVVFTLSLVLNVTFGVPLFPAMLVVGIAAIVYTTLGGMKAVIWTDVAQFVILFGGLLAALAYTIAKVPGGFAEIWNTAHDAGKLRVVNTDIDLTARYVIWTLIPYGFIEFLGAKTVDQMNVQRYLSARSAKNAKMAMLMSSCFSLPVWLLLFGVGMSLFAFYTIHPSPEVAQFIADGKFDRIFPHYIATEMPVGLRGLMIAALFAAAMSTMDSVLNVLATISVVNVYQKAIRPDADDRQCLWLAKIMTVIWGMIIIGLAFCMTNIESILKTIQSIAGMLIGPMVGIFVLGMFTRRANWQGGMIGLFLALLAGLLVKYQTSLTFTLYGIITLGVSMLTGYLASLLFPAQNVTGDMLWRWRGWREMLFGGTIDEVTVERAKDTGTIS